MPEGAASSAGTLPSSPPTPRLPNFGVPPRRSTPHRAPLSSTLIPAARLHAAIGLPPPENDPHRSTRAPRSVLAGTVGLPSAPPEARVHQNRAWHPPPILFAPKATAQSGRANRASGEERPEPSTSGAFGVGGTLGDTADPWIKSLHAPTHAGLHGGHHTNGQSEGIAAANSAVAAAGMEPASGMASCHGRLPSSGTSAFPADAFPPVPPEDFKFAGSRSPPVRMAGYGGPLATGARKGAGHNRRPMPHGVPVQMAPPPVQFPHGFHGVGFHDASAARHLMGTRAPPSSPLASTDEGYRLHNPRGHRRPGAPPSRGHDGRTAPSAGLIGTTVPEESAMQIDDLQPTSSSSAAPAPASAAPAPAMAAMMPPAAAARPVPQALPGGSATMPAGSTAALPTWCNGLPASVPGVAEGSTPPPAPPPAVLARTNSLLAGGLELNNRVVGATRAGAPHPHLAVDLTDKPLPKVRPPLHRPQLPPPQLATRRIGLSYVAKGPTGGVFFKGGHRHKLAPTPLPQRPPSPFAALTPRTADTNGSVQGRNWAAKQLALGSSTWSR